MGYNKYLWGAEKKEDSISFGQVKLSPLNEAHATVYEVYIHYGAGHKCEIADKIPDNVVPKALYSFGINYYNIIRINSPVGLKQDDGVLVETRRIANRNMSLYGHTRYYLVKTIS